MAEVIGSGEDVAAVEVDVLVLEGRKMFEVSVVDGGPLGPEVLDGVVHVAAVPEGEHVGDEPEGTELLFLARPVGLVDVASPTMEDVPGELVAGFLAVELHEDPPALGRVGHVVEDGDRSADAAEFGQRSG